MKKIAKTFLIFFVIVFLDAASYGQQPTDAFAEANQFYVNKQYTFCLQPEFAISSLKIKSFERL